MHTVPGGSDHIDDTLHAGWIPEFTVEESAHAPRYRTSRGLGHRSCGLVGPSPHTVKRSYAAGTTSIEGDAMPEHSISTTSEGVAIGGYDTVAYFTSGSAQLGLPEHAHDWGGATWRFATSDNAAQFAENPENFAPKFGGHCAFGASMGKTAEASPKSWRMIDGNLCLMKSGSVKALSGLFTSKIRKAIAATD